ncbi:hypothetical protein [Pseudalkalibacillus hwajinpoensis]|uniref:hypothetical protein n=1 Tax=Guptibacillus hwajinpoensis TaxID=208199 RepID=UPI001CFC8C7C|nr:hypothetical protein [Pseudalkalibacillus hwajinpoensis]
MLESRTKTTSLPTLESLAKFLYVCEMMALSVYTNKKSSLKNVPELRGIPGIQKEINNLQIFIHMT